MSPSERPSILKTIEVYHRRLGAGVEDGTAFRARPHLKWARRKAEYLHVATVTVFPEVHAKAKALGALELVFRYMQFEPEYTGEAAHVATRFHRPMSEVRPTAVGDVLIFGGRAYEVGDSDFAPIGYADTNDT
jgi:hypothetical protein